MDITGQTIEDIVEDALGFDSLNLSFREKRMLEHKYKNQILTDILQMKLRAGQVWVEKQCFNSNIFRRRSEVIAITSVNQVVYKYNNEHGVEVCVCEDSKSFVTEYQLEEDL